MLSARYGIGNKYVDVTAKVRRLFIRGNNLVIEKGTVFNKLFGDPIYGKVKELEIRLEDGTIKKIGEMEGTKGYNLVFSSGTIPALSREVPVGRPLIARVPLTGVVITTHGQMGFYVRQCLDSFLRTKGNFFIVLYVNESTDPTILSIPRDYPKVEYIYVANQTMGGGLTGTWNRGIALCKERGCDVIILSNDDIMFSPTALEPLISAARSSTALRYFGPLTNAPGPAECNRPQRSLGPQNKSPFELRFNGKHSNLNGFFMVFPISALEANMFDATNYFDPSKPFAGNETEWFVRFQKIGGRPVVVPRSFIYHYKNASWRARGAPTLKERTCIFIIVTGNYESKMMFKGDSYGVDAYCYSDNFGILSKAIAAGFHPVCVKLINGDTKLTQRTIKTACHRYLPDKYDVSIYMDGNIQPKFASVDKFLNFVQVNKYDLICYRHPFAKTIAKERDAILKYGYETKARLADIMNEIKASGFNDNKGHTETSVLVRWHKRLVSFGEEWASMMMRCIRDQMTFDYLLWKHNVKYRRMDKFPIKRFMHSGNTKGKIVRR